VTCRRARGKCWFAPLLLPVGIALAASAVAGGALAGEAAPRRLVTEVGSLRPESVVLVPVSMTLSNTPNTPNTPDDGDEYEEYEEYEEGDPNDPGAASGTGGASPTTSVGSSTLRRDMVVEGFVVLNALILMGAGLSLPRRIARSERKTAFPEGKPEGTPESKQPPARGDARGDGTGGTERAW
jgi:hypothetical protein